MRIRLLGSATGDESALQYLSSYLINDSVAIDAGSIGICGTPAQQRQVRNIFLTHSHIDHIATLPIFLDNIFEPGRDPVVVHGHTQLIADLQRHVFNDVIWPDFVRLSQPGREFLRLNTLEAEVPYSVDGLTITPVLVNHLVTTHGYIVTDGFSTVVFGADSGPTDRIWELAAGSPGPCSVILEACFPNAMHHLACISKHLTPELFAAEVAKMPALKTIIAVHIKATRRADVTSELNALGIDNLVIGMPDSDYHL